jgi:hypothetical protein
MVLLKELIMLTPTQHDSSSKKWKIVKNFRQGLFKELIMLHNSNSKKWETRHRTKQEQLGEVHIWVHCTYYRIFF